MERKIDTDNEREIKSSVSIPISHSRSPILHSIRFPRNSHHCFDLKRRTVCVLSRFFFLICNFSLCLFLERDPVISYKIKKRFIRASKNGRTITRSKLKNVKC